MLTTAFIPLMAIAAMQAAPTIVQKSSGWCSPNIAYVTGNVTVNCNGVDPRALTRLNAELTRKNLQLADKIKEADEWTRRYKELEAELSRAGDDSVLSHQAEEYLHQGELEKAGAILDQILSREDKQTDSTAANHYKRALVFELQFLLPDALPHLKKAYQLAVANEIPPDEVKYGREYAYALILENYRGPSETVSVEILEKARQLAQTDPATYQPAVAGILNNLGVLYYYSHREKEAEAAYKEVLTTYRQLVKTTPQTYNLELAGALNNLGLLYEEDKQMTEAEPAYKEALEIQTQLAKANPTYYQPYVADTLTDLGNLYSDTHRMKEAEDAYQKALDIRRQLAKNSPAAYQPAVALTLNNLGILYSDTNRLKEAEAAYIEALSIYRQVAQTNPDAYRPSVAMTQSNLGSLYADTSRAKEAEAADKEALDIYHELAKTNPGTYEQDLARTLNNLGLLYRDANRPMESEATLRELASVYRQLAKANPEAQKALALTLDRLGKMYGDNDQYGAVGADGEALDIYRQLAKADPSYQADVTDMLNRLAILHFSNGYTQDAIKESEESIRISREQYKANPNGKTNDLARSLITGTLVQQESAVRCQLARELAGIAPSAEMKHYADQQLATCTPQ